MTKCVTSAGGGRDGLLTGNNRPVASFMAER